MPRVVIVGGGVAGLSAAQELIERGFLVDLYERRELLGGKARSILVPGSGVDGRRDLPGEHGFRFFPRFYQHLDHSMSRIPFARNARGVLDNLTDTTRMAVVQPGKPRFSNVTRMPRTLDDLATVGRLPRTGSFSLKSSEAASFARALFCSIAASKERREAELDNIPFSMMADAMDASSDYQALVGLTQIFVALRADQISAKTVGHVGTQMLSDIFRPGPSSARVLNGPTSDAWLEPWREHLLRMGVRFHLSATLRRIELTNGKISALHIEHSGSQDAVVADAYLLAVPVEVAAKLINEPVLRLAPKLRSLKTLAGHTRWMVGLQFFFKRPVPTIHGHVIHLRSPWALTSVFHEQFWREGAMRQFGDGEARAVLSVDISDWDTPGYNGRPAKACSPQEIFDEVWEQLRVGLRGERGEELLDRRDVVASFLDPGYHPATKGSESSHEEPLFANVAGLWALRPEAETSIENFFLAGDFVRTNTDLACMEGANESARRAVNGIIRLCQPSAAPCRIFSPRQFALLAPLRALDSIAYRLGLPWLFGRLPESSKHSEPAPKTYLSTP